MSALPDLQGTLTPPTWVSEFGQKRTLNTTQMISSLKVHEAFFDALIGKRVAHVWRGYGSTIFLEFGDLSPTQLLRGGAADPTGEATLSIDWSWRIELPKSILGGSWSSEGRWPSMFRKLLGATVHTVNLEGHLLEISIYLSNGLRVVSFMTAEGQPSWTITVAQPALGSLFVKAGKLTVERGDADVA